MGKYNCYKYGLSDTMLSVLMNLGEGEKGCSIEDLVFPCHVNVTADGLSEWITTTISFDDLLEELCTYHITKSAESCTVDFSLYPFLDDCTLGHYSLYFSHPDYVKVQEPATWMSIQRLQALLL